MMPTIVIAWVGSGFLESISVARVLVLCNALGFIAYPMGAWLFVTEQLRHSYLAAGLALVAFGALSIALLAPLGFKAFAVGKLGAFITMGVYYTSLLVRHLKLDVGKLLEYYVLPLVLPVLVLISAGILIQSEAGSGEQSGLAAAAVKCCILAIAASGVL